MRNFKIDDFSILGTEAFHDFDERGVDDLTHGDGDSFDKLSDFSSTKFSLIDSQETDQQEARRLSSRRRTKSLGSRRWR